MSASDAWRGGDGGIREELAAGVVQLEPKTKVEATSILPSLNGKTARSWRGIVPFTHLAREGAYDSHYRTAGIAGRTRRRGGVAARGTRAAGGDAARWLYWSRVSRPITAVASRFFLAVPTGG